MPPARQNILIRLARWWAGGLARGLAGFLGVFTLLNLLGRCGAGWADATAWWIDLRLVGPLWADALLTAAAVLLVAWFLHDRPRTWRRRATAGLTLGLAAACLHNAAGCWQAEQGGLVRLGSRLPLSVIVAASLLVIAIAVGRSGRASPRRRASRFAQAAPFGAERNPRPHTFLPALATVLLCLLALPLAQMFFFGRSDYRRRADAIVVFGAKAYADGTPSQALADRVATACRLYHAGYAPRLIFSGGPGDGGAHEAHVMRRLALDAGVPAGAIFLDEQGLNTHATAANTASLFARLGVRRVLAVSHFYHLPRIKLIYRRLGWEVYTVPAEETYPLTAMPVYITREIAALWAYYLRPVGA